MNRQFIYNSNYVLRKILNCEENIDILKDFIEKILKIEIEKITLREYLGNKVKYIPPEEKCGIAEVRIITKDEKKLNVGIQIIDGIYIQEKILTYASLIHLNQFEYKNESEYAKTITINILDLKYFSTLNIHKVMNFLDRKFKYYPAEEIEFHILELPKFDKKSIETFEDAWVAYFKGDDENLVQEAIEKCGKISKLDKLLKDYWEFE